VLNSSGPPQTRGSMSTSNPSLRASKSSSEPTITGHVWMPGGPVDPNTPFVKNPETDRPVDWLTRPETAEKGSRTHRMTTGLATSVLARMASSMSATSLNPSADDDCGPSPLAPVSSSARVSMW